MCVSRVLRKRIDEELDENCIIQPGRDIPKEQYVRRRAYTKQHKSVWEAAIKKYRHVKCIFQNCHFLALSVEDMISHFGYCNGDGSFAKFACPYCEGRVTSEKILEIHIRRSHEYEQYNLINNHFLDMREDSSGSVHSEDRQLVNEESGFRTLDGGKVMVDVKIEGMGCEYNEGMVSHGLFSAENDAENVENPDDNVFDCSEEVEVEDSIMQEEQATDVTKQTNNQGKCYKGDHVYFKKMGKLLNEGDSNSLLVMKNNNLKHYSGPRNVTDKIPNCKVEEEPKQELKIRGEDTASIADNDSTENEMKFDGESDSQGKYVRQMIKFSFPSVQNTRRKIHQWYTNSWNESIKTKGFARCLVATCNFISLDIYHIQNHFKTCSGVPANGPNLCVSCNSWLPSAVELSIHSERCKTYRALTDPARVSGEKKGDGELNCEGKTAEDCSRVEISTVTEPDPFQINTVAGGDATTGTLSKKEKTTTLRISDIMKMKENGNMDINRIIQPGPVLPKDQYLRRRAYTKQHKTIWEAALAKHKYVKCIFQNCHFVAMSIEDMIYHFGYCIGDGSFAKFRCRHCSGRLTSKMILDIHIRMSHPEMATNDSDDDSGEMDGECGSIIDDVLPSVEEMKKLVSSKEIKTYKKNSARSKFAQKSSVPVKSEGDDCSRDGGEALSCVAILDENRLVSDGSASTLITEINEVGTDSVSDKSEKVTSLSENANSLCREEEAEEQCIGCNNKSSEETQETIPDFTVGKSLEKDMSTDNSRLYNRENDIHEVESDREKLLDEENVNFIKGKVKNYKNPPKEVEDPGTSKRETEEETPVKEEGKSSGRKCQRNSQGSRGSSRNRSKSEDGKNDSLTGLRSSRRRGLHGKSPERAESESIADETENPTSPEKRQEQNDDARNQHDNDSKIARVEPVEDEGGTKPRKRGRPPKRSSAAVETPSKVSEPEVKLTPVPAKKGRRGRKRKHEEEPEEMEDVGDDSDVKCAKCDFRAKRQRFSDHNFKKHIGLSWIEGENPLDPGNEEEIAQRVKQAFKVVKSATCEICNSVKKSALGFISHIQNCGKSEEEKEALKVTCPFCPSRVLKYSLPMHLKLSHSDSPPDSNKTEEDVEVLTKRRSAIRAVNKFQEVLKQSEDDEEQKCKNLYVVYEKGVSKFPKLPVKIQGLWKKMVKEKKKIPCRRGSCLVESSNVQEAKKHHFTCSELPEKVYVCQQCDFYSIKEEGMREHINIHPNIDGDFTVGSEEEKIEEDVEINEVDDAAEPVRNKSRIPENPIDALEATYKMKFFVRENLLNGRQTRFCRQSLRMMLNSELEATTDQCLPLSELHTNPEDWIGVSLNTAYNHLPCLEESISYAYGQTEKTNPETWRKLGRFEGELLEDSPIIFTGGSVLSMSWCKISSIRSYEANPRQYLAVSSSKSMETFQNIHDVPDDFSGCVQIWDCGDLKSTPEIPKMIIGIIHNSGQVWDLSWFPIDTHEESSNDGVTTRIGILGAACQDGTIRVWSICDSRKLKSKFRLPLYKTEPKIVLQLEGGEAISCLRLAIGKSGIVVGGFANGLAAVWNLKAIKSPFCRKTGKTYILKPHLSFQAHRTSITALSICPNSDRYIATSGLDRFLRLWDLECVINPIESTLREVCLDNAWPQHWPVTISTFEDVIPCTGKGMVKAFRDAYCDKHRAPLTIDNTCWSLSVNDWMNIICGCNSQGEVKIRYMRNMFMADEKFRLRTGHIFSTTELKLLNNAEGETSSDDAKKKSRTIARSYDEGTRYFGLVFKDYAIRDDAKQKSETKCKKSIVCMEEYPLTSINKVCWNPNYGSFKFLAIGHQSGFVRIKQLEDIRCDEEVVRFYKEAKEIFKENLKSSNP